MKESVNRGYFFKGRGLVVSILLALVLFVSLGIDQYSKFHAQNTLITWQDPDDSSMYLGKKYPVFSVGNKEPSEGQIPLYFNMNFQYSRNKGAAFSMFANLKDEVRVPMFYIIIFFAVILISYYLYILPINHVLSRYGLIMVLSGALGNCIDRVLRGYVVDFIDTDWNFFGWVHDFAIFNVADVCINIGIICLVLDMIIQYRAEKKNKRLKASEEST